LERFLFPGSLENWDKTPSAQFPELSFFSSIQFEGILMTPAISTGMYEESEPADLCQFMSIIKTHLKLHNAIFPFSQMSQGLIWTNSVCLIESIWE
jgi:hypothetical protein